MVWSQVSLSARPIEEALSAAAQPRIGHYR